MHAQYNYLSSSLKPMFEFAAGSKPSPQILVWLQAIEGDFQRRLAAAEAEGSAERAAIAAAHSKHKRELAEVGSAMAAHFHDLESDARQVRLGCLLAVVLVLHWSASTSANSQIWALRWQRTFMICTAMRGTWVGDARLLLCWFRTERQGCI